LKPVLLDLFCGGGGCAKGYKDAGFTVVGVDIEPQPRYAGDAFIQGGALEFLAEHGHEYDAIHASPPCQAYSIMRNLPWLDGIEYPALIKPTKDRLDTLGKPYVLENVMGAKKGSPNLRKHGLEDHGLVAPYLCGTMFGLPFYRHRLFATNWLLVPPWRHPRHENAVLPGRMFGERGHMISFFEDELPELPLMVNDPGIPRKRGQWEQGYQERHPNDSQQAALASESSDKRGLESWPGRRSEPAGLATAQPQNGIKVGIGHHAGWRFAAEAMGIDWMKREELTQAIPPAYTEYIGQFLQQVV